ncbi:hypothetical protein PVAND_009220 [Polypedilum vanderplanki]|uniref:Chromatin target of PRMT1 protein C-terminal domain-containing protein n=1 Tax=Polypedilum vanderplanki TaxID=319348 RepID=A0A9J6CBY6_POLVA|nr:hypothetical protein PVAND_009220 [Polypedilum vanderplanki]
MNTTTAITLNDRFSMIKKDPSQNSVNSKNGRARSRSRNRNRRSASQLRGSRKSQQLLKQMERQHKMRMALKLKNKSIVASRGRVQGQIRRNQNRLAGVIRKTLTPQMLKRSNSQTRFIPLNDAPSRINRGRSRSRSRSRNRMQNTGSIQDRLGVRKGPSRMRQSIQNRGGQQQQQQQRGRSRSRNRLNRNNFKQQQPQNNAIRRRSNSVNARLGNNGPARNRSRNNLKQNSVQLRRSNSINARLGNVKGRAASRNRNNRNQLNRPMTGRIIKRKANQQNRKIGVRKANAIVGNAAARNVKKLQRGNNQQARGRARTRGQRQNNQGQQQQQRRGRSRTRRANQPNRGGQGGGKQKISKEQLDKQLDEYMAKA